MVKGKDLIIILILNLTQLAPSGSSHLIQVDSGQTAINLIILHLNTLLK